MVPVGHPIGVDFDHFGRHTCDNGVIGFECFRDHAAYPHQDAVSDGRSGAESHGAADVAIFADVDVPVVNADAVSPELRSVAGDPRVVAQNEGPCRVEHVPGGNHRVAADLDQAFVFGAFELLPGRPVAADESIAAADSCSAVDDDIHGAAESASVADPGVGDGEAVDFDDDPGADARILDVVAKQGTIQVHAKGVEGQLADDVGGIGFHVSRSSYRSTMCRSSLRLSKCSLTKALPALPMVSHCSGLAMSTSSCCRIALTLRSGTR